MQNLRLINIVDSLAKVNFGVWNAAVSMHAILEQQHGIKPEVWHPAVGEKDRHEIDPETAKSLYPTVIDSASASTLNRLIDQRELDPANTIIQTHGVWQYPTAWGNRLSKLGFKWVYCPHGMLEPWCFSQKWLKKKLFFRFVESRRVQAADVIRAVGLPEQNNLKTLFQHKNVELIPNGVSLPIDERGVPAAKDKKNIFLFLGRLHAKKGIVPLVNAFHKASWDDGEKPELIIAGPDQGELEKIQPLLDQSPNIEYIGPVYGEAKSKLLNEAKFFVLPSFSEGFPSSTIEAINHGMVPLISDGCNFPELFERGLGIKVGTKVVVRPMQSTSDRFKAVESRGKTIRINCNSSRNRTT